LAEYVGEWVWEKGEVAEEEMRHGEEDAEKKKKKRKKKYVFVRGGNKKGEM